MVDMLFNHVHVSILQLCAWAGCGTPMGYANTCTNNIIPTASLDTNYRLSVSYFHHLQLLSCAVEDYKLIEYNGKDNTTSDRSTYIFLINVHHFHTHKEKMNKFLNCYIFSLFVVCYLIK